MTTSTDLVSLLSEAIADYQPERSFGHSAIFFFKWQSFTISQIFEAMNDQLMRNICGAIIVECDIENAQDFFHLGNNSSRARFATLDDLNRGSNNVIVSSGFGHNPNPKI